MVQQRCFGSLTRACPEFGVPTAFWVPGHRDFRDWVTRKKLEVGIPGNPAYSAGEISTPCPLGFFDFITSLWAIHTAQSESSLLPYVDWPEQVIVNSIGRCMRLQ